MMDRATLYDTDYDAWLERNLESLRQFRFEELDVERLIEEMESMGRKERGEVTSRILVLIAHLLKWQYQSAHRSSSWRGSIAEQRLKLIRRLRLSPSLKPYLPEAIEDAYGDAVELAMEETGLDRGAFPGRCPYTPEQLLDKVFWP